jgi:phenylacetic acid degradation operon negative regulatory protein
MATRRNTAGPTTRGEPLLERPLTARSVIASLLLGMHPPRLAGARLVRWCGIFGIAEGTARVALHRMAASGELVARDGDYELAGAVRSRQRVQDWSLAPKLQRWNGEWRMGAVRPVARDANDRARLRDAFRRMRYAETREGVWVRPDNLPRASAPTEAWDAAEAQCDWWRATPDRDARELAAECFDPAGWAARAERIGARLDRATPALADADDDVLADAFDVGAATLAHVRADPLLPPALCPAPWPGERLRDGYGAYRDAFAVAIREWFRDA